MIKIKGDYRWLKKNMQLRLLRFCKQQQRRYGAFADESWAHWSSPYKECLGKICHNRRTIVRRTSIVSCWIRVTAYWVKTLSENRDNGSDVIVEKSVVNMKRLFQIWFLSLSLLGTYHVTTCCLVGWQRRKDHQFSVNLFTWRNYG